MKIMKIIYSILFCLIIINLSNQQKNWEKTITYDAPSHRYLPGCTCQEDKMMVFGGRSHSWLDFHNDTHILNFSSKKWNNLHFSTKISTNAPVERFGSHVVIIKENGYLFGGAHYNENNTLVIFNDIWKFDFINNIWIKINISSSSQIPPKRYEGSTFVYEKQNKFCIFSGHGENVLSIFEDFWCFDILTNKWSNLTSNCISNSLNKNNLDKNGKLPYPRFGSSVSEIEDGKFYLSFGRTYRGSQFIKKPVDFCNDTWLVDLTQIGNDKCIFTDISDKNSQLNRPIGRYNAHSVAIKDEKENKSILIIYGGERLIALQKPPIWEYYSDTWYLDSKTLKWTNITNKVFSKSIPERSSGCSCLHHSDKKFYIFGGKRNFQDDSEVLYNDLIQLDLNFLVSNSNVLFKSFNIILSIIVSILIIIW